MTGVDALAAQVRAGAAGDDRLVHTVCLCDPDRALCGKSMTGREWLPMGAHPDDCRVCDDLARLPCQSCDRGNVA